MLVDDRFLKFIPTRKNRTMTVFRACVRAPPEREHVNIVFTVTKNFKREAEKCFMDMREQKFGIEIELTGITREKAAEVIGTYLGHPVTP